MKKVEWKRGMKVIALHTNWPDTVPKDGVIQDVLATMVYIHFLDGTKGFVFKSESELKLRGTAA